MSVLDLKLKYNNMSHTLIRNVIYKSVLDLNLKYNTMSIILMTKSNISLFLKLKVKNYKGIVLP